ncbi:MAG: rhomboid family intramembrane serine protease [Bacteroidales bacterium]|nr:rhomboid family intramembrane serine protease [Bacteroidales bacterium]
MNVPFRLIAVNVAVFALMKTVWLLIPSLDISMESVVGWLALPASWSGVAVKPWTVISYMFTHLDFWHLLVNCLWLAWFGCLLQDVAGGRQVIVNYIAGGITGALLYVSFNSGFFPGEDACLIGASAATLAVITATLVSEPGRRVKIALVGIFPLRKLAVAGAVIFLFASLEMAPSQTAAHFGGIIAGGLWALAWRLYHRRHMRLMQQRTRSRLLRMELLEKARRNGYSSLTDAEKLSLFDLSVPRRDAN